MESGFGGRKWRVSFLCLVVLSRFLWVFRCFVLVSGKHWSVTFLLLTGIDNWREFSGLLKEKK